MSKKIFRFLITGGISTTIDFCIYMLLSNYISIVMSKIISMTIASIYAYFVNKSWTFSDKSKVESIQIF
jgi:putative flippase GtrA